MREDEDDTPRGSRFGSGLTLGVLGGLVAGVAFGWWAAGGALPSMPQPAQPHQAPAAGAAPVQAVTPSVDLNAQALQAAVAETDPIVIGVFGDSMADGLWAGLYRQLRDEQNVRVVRFSRPSTGLTRYDYVDVGAQTAEQLAGEPVDIAVFLIGTNDRQALQGDGRQALTYGEAEWRAAYAGRVDALADQVRGAGAALYWVGLPRMRSERADAGAELVNDIFAGRGRAKGFPFIDTTAATSDESRLYAAYLPTGPNGRLQLARANDGIHMTMSGYLRMAEPVAAQIRADLSRARASTQPPAPPGSIDQAPVVDGAA
ncbi:DUF459 domain-containing protein [Brevundimonas sp. 2R-24]|uniref:DUF459 domain-containing protein n=1 Tax=Peiella sedimenti TaxID=3061083 RepID=A0ABT8SPF3_9CAUL|nr:DUF459 domain-containing protein [Caulobacteraceae bacterium XZ-24]